MSSNLQPMTDAFKQSIAAKVLSELRTRGISQAQFGKTIGVSQGYISMLNYPEKWKFMNPSVWEAFQKFVNSKEYISNHSSIVERTDKVHQTIKDAIISSGPEINQMKKAETIIADHEIASFLISRDDADRNYYIHRAGEIAKAMSKCIASGYVIPKEWMKEYYDIIELYELKKLDIKAL